jgi:hypothetical protein
MKKLSLLAAVVVALATTAALPTSAQAGWWHHWHHWHHWHWHQATLFAPIVDVTSWWEHPYYFWSPYSVVDHYGDYPNVFVGDPILVHRVTEVGPYHYKPVVW